MEEFIANVVWVVIPILLFSLATIWAENSAKRGEIVNQPKSSSIPSNQRWLVPKGSKVQVQLDMGVTTIRRIVNLQNDEYGSSTKRRYSNTISNILQVSDTYSFLKGENLLNDQEIQKYFNLKKIKTVSIQILSWN
jgi:hypothetical protein